MGVIRNLAKRREEKNQAKKIAKKAIKTVIFAILKKILLGAMLLLIVGVLFTWLSEEITAEETPKTTYEQLEVSDLKELVEIKGNKLVGYHLEFVEGIDEKLDNLIEVLNRREGNRSFNKNDKAMIKQMIKAEMITQFPDLGGLVDEENENTFQGAITVRRVTPDKEIGELISTGAGEKTTEDDLKDDKEEDEEEVKYEKGQQLKTKTTAIVYLKGDYDFLGNRKSEEGATSKVSTMFSKVEGVDNSVYIKNGQTVYYTGNDFYYDNNTYIEVSKEKDSEVVIGYVKKINVKTQTTTQKDSDETDQEEEEEQTTKQPTKTIGDGNKEFVIAIAAGHNSTDDKGYSDDQWVEEELTIEVAKEVERLFSDYYNIKVVQTGSTEENPGNVKKDNRTELAKDANPDMCIQIYFNTGGETGTEVCYEYGDEKSQKLAEMLSESISNKMGIKDRGTVTKEGVSDNYSIIDSSADTGFPSVITKGCFLDNKKDIATLKKGGVSQYAQGIVEACEKYLIATEDRNANICSKK